MHPALSFKPSVGVLNLKMFISFNPIISFFWEIYLRDIIRVVDKDLGKNQTNNKESVS